MVGLKYQEMNDPALTHWQRFLHPMRVAQEVELASVWIYGKFKGMEREIGTVGK